MRLEGHGGGLCPAQVYAMIMLNLSAARMVFSTQTTAIGENAPAEQVCSLPTIKILKFTVAKNLKIQSVNKKFLDVVYYMLNDF